MGIAMEIPIGCALEWVKYSKVIDSLAALCTMWWKIRNKLTLIMDLLIHYKICTMAKSISFSQVSWPKVWEALLAVWTNSVRPIQQCLFSPMDKTLGTLDHLDGLQ